MNQYIYIPPPISNNINTNSILFNNKGSVIDFSMEPILNWDIYNNRPQYKEYLVLGQKYCNHFAEKPFNNSTKRKLYNNCN